MGFKVVQCVNDESRLLDIDRDGNIEVLNENCDSSCKSCGYGTGSNSSNDCLSCKNKNQLVDAKFDDLTGSCQPQNHEYYNGIGVKIDKETWEAIPKKNYELMPTTEIPAPDVTDVMGTQSSPPVPAPDVMDTQSSPPVPAPVPAPDVTDVMDTKPLPLPLPTLESRFNSRFSRPESRRDIHNQLLEENLKGDDLIQAKGIIYKNGNDGELNENLDCHRCLYDLNVPSNEIKGTIGSDSNLCRVSNSINKALSFEGGYDNLNPYKTKNSDAFFESSYKKPVCTNEVTSSFEYDYERYSELRRKAVNNYNNKNSGVKEHSEDSKKKLHIYCYDNDNNETSCSNQNAYKARCELDDNTHVKCPKDLGSSTAAYDYICYDKNGDAENCTSSNVFNLLLHDNPDEVTPKKESGVKATSIDDEYNNLSEKIGQLQCTGKTGKHDTCLNNFNLCIPNCFKNDPESKKGLVKTLGPIIKCADGLLRKNVNNIKFF